MDVGLGGSSVGEARPPHGPPLSSECPGQLSRIYTMTVSCPMPVVRCGASSLMRGGANTPAAAASKGEGQISQGQQRAGHSQHGTWISIHMTHMAPVEEQATDINTDPTCSMTTGPDTALGSSSRPDVTMDPVDGRGPSDQYVPSEGMALKYQHSLRWQPRCWASSWPSIITGAMDIGTDPGYGRVTDLDLALGSSGPGATTALGSSTGHPHLCIEFISFLFFLQ